jgi:hypothetical protein
MGGGGRLRRTGLAWIVVLSAAEAAAGPFGWGPPPPRGALTPCASPAAPVSAPAPDVRLVWVDVAGVARPAFPEARREIVALLERVGLRATVRQGDVRGISDGSELTVVVLPGAPPGTHLHDRVMGATQRTPDGVRAMWVYASGVGTTLGLDIGSGRFWSLAERRQFGTALGRVVVHEVVHALAPQRPHDREGLMAERLGRAQLLRPRLDVDRRTARALRESLKGGGSGDGAVAGMP